MGEGGQSGKRAGSSPREASWAVLKPLLQWTQPGMSPDAEGQAGWPLCCLEPLLLLAPLGGLRIGAWAPILYMRLPERAAAVLPGTSAATAAGQLTGRPVQPRRRL